MGTHLVYGNEPYLVHDYIETWKNSFDEFSIVEAYEFNESVVEELSYAGIFSGKLVIVMLDELKKNVLLEKYLEKPTHANELVVAVRGGINTKLKVYSSFDEVIVKDKLDKRGLVDFVHQYVTEREATLSRAGWDEFYLRMNYDSVDVSLYNVSAELDKLCCYVGEGGTIDVNEVCLMVDKNIDQKSFEFAGMIIHQEVQKVYDQIGVMEADTKTRAISVLSLLLYNFRMIYKNRMYPKEPAFGRVVKCGLTAEQAMGCMQILLDSIRNNKKGFLQEGVAIRVAVCRILSYLSKEVCA